MKSISYLQELACDPNKIEQRLQARITPSELFGLIFAVGILMSFIWLSPRGLYFDLANYLRTTNGDYSNYYYAYWFVPIFQFLGRLPIIPVYAFWNLIGIIAVFFAVRVFGGSVVLTLISFQMTWMVYQGQITGLLLGGAALLWWGMARRHWDWAGLGLLIVSTKFQTGFFFGLFLWLLAPITWRERLRVLVVPVVIALVSLVLYPFWFLDVWHSIQITPPNAMASVSLWSAIGPLALVLWIAPLVLPLTRTQRFVLLVATTSLALPYFQQSDLIALFVLPVGWIPLLGNIGWLYLMVGDLGFLFLIPLLVYLSIVVPAVWNIFKAMRQ